MTYGVHKFHHFHTVTNHFYISRPIFLHRTAFNSWPADLQHAMREAVTAAVAFQRELPSRRMCESRHAIAAQGCEIAELTADEHAAFAAAVAPLLKDARQTFGPDARETATA